MTEALRLSADESQPHTGCTSFPCVVGRGNSLTEMDDISIDSLPLIAKCPFLSSSSMTTVGPSIQALVLGLEMVSLKRGHPAGCECSIGLPWSDNSVSMRSRQYRKVDPVDDIVRLETLSETCSCLHESLRSI